MNCGQCSQGFSKPEFSTRFFDNFAHLSLKEPQASSQDQIMPPKRKRDEKQDDEGPVGKKAKLEEKDSSSDLSKSNTNAKRQPPKKKIDPKIKLHPLNEPLPTVFDVVPSDGDEEEEINGADPFSKDELEIMKISQTIREKPNWLNKFFDDHIRRKWKSEALDQGADEAVVNYVFKELEQYYAFCIDGSIEMATVEGVYQSDSLIPADLKAALAKQVAVLENVKDEDKDWHPGSDDQVLDLVHPSLHCYVSGVTKVTRKHLPWSQFIGSGSVSAIPTGLVSHPGKSEKYHWLPSEFNVDEDGKVTIASYINNLHPETHADLYKSLASIFEEFVPMFNKVLTDVVHPRALRFRPEDYHWNEETEEYELEDVPVFKDINAPPSVVNLNGRELQVIVKLANIVLTPENPEYDGGVWHVEGMINERIVATGIYYYASENISESRLEFRKAVKMPDLGFLDNNEERESFASTIYNIRDGTPSNQKLGSILTKEDRCIVFPNLYQHKVAPFKLVDDSKPGVRKILVFFLVDPVTPILSTANVPPQQSEWIKMEVAKRQGTRFEDLPNELMQEILKKVDFGMTLDQAKQFRLELMEERKQYVRRTTRAFEKTFDFEEEEEDEDDYNLCEH